MIEIAPGLYRITRPYPGREEALPAEALVYVGRPKNGGYPFVVRPYRNEKNRWLWREPTLPLEDEAWAQSLKRLRSEGFYTLPRELHPEGGGRWLKNAIVQLGYNTRGRAILFVAERRDDVGDNALFFSDRGTLIDDDLLEELVWAPILPVQSAGSDAGPPYLN